MSRERIEYLLDNLQEGLDVEVKNWLGGLQQPDARAKLAKEIIALANNDGGYVFIGFDDEGEGHPSLQPEEGYLEAFSQDQISDIVRRYVHPPVQCVVSFHERDGTDVRHPIITVPGGHRTPVWAARASPDQRSLQIRQVYVRRPGGASEPAQTQDDWEKLLERLVRARQVEQLAAIRSIIDPPVDQAEPVRTLRDWSEESTAVWRDLLEPLAPNDARRHRHGYWTLAFEMDFPQAVELRELRDFARAGAPQYSGWPPFTVLGGVNSQPRPVHDIIQAWLVDDADPANIVDEAEDADFWRLSTDGKGFIVRGFLEDGQWYRNNHGGDDAIRFFDWTTPIYRTFEDLKFIEALGQRFGSPDANFNVQIKYFGMQGRELRQDRLRYHLRAMGPCGVGEIETSFAGRLHMLELNIDEVIYSLLRPIYEQFAFTELPRRTVSLVVGEAEAYR